MEFMSKYNATFLISVDRKYNKKFKDFDDYSLFLYELTKNELKYYYQLEKDIEEYCKYQQERKKKDGKTKCQTKNS